MRKITFEVDIQLFGQDPAAQLQDLVGQLTKINNVGRVDTNKTGLSFCKLLLFVQFIDANQAKQIHGKIMRLLTSTPDIAVMGITTNLSDVFD